jgi:hypothetical protein
MWARGAGPVGVADERLTAGAGPAGVADERLMAAVDGCAAQAAALQRCARAVASCEAELRALGLLPAAFDALGPALVSHLAFEEHGEEAREAARAAAARRESAAACAAALAAKAESRGAPTRAAHELRCGCPAELDPDLSDAPCAVITSDIPGDMRSSLRDARFQWCSRDQQATAAGLVTRVMWGSEARFWADAAPEAADATRRFGHSFGVTEDWLTSKDALATLVHVLRGRVPWMQPGYRVAADKDCSGSLQNELAAFVGHFALEAAALKAAAGAPSAGSERVGRRGNVWIVKPATLSRSRGITVADSLEQILAACMAQVREGRVCVVQKYVERPMLFRACFKFDLRLLVAVKRLDPPVLFVYDRMIARVAAKPFDAASDDMLSHLTVTQYLPLAAAPQGPRGPPAEPPPLVPSEELWSDLETRGVDVFGAAGVVARCHAAVAALFRAVVRREGGSLGRAGEQIGVRPHDRVRALYGFDVILDDLGQPYVLEANYKPDLKRVLKERPAFLDQLFDVLFADGSRSRAPCAALARPTEHGAFVPLPLDA